MSANKPPHNAPIPFINEPKNDNFTIFKKDPRLDMSVYQLGKKLKAINIRKNLEENFAKIKEDEDFFDALREHKLEEIKKITETLENSPTKNRELILSSLSDLADNILYTAFKRIYQKLKNKHGMPSYLNSYKQTLETPLAIVGMGKLGGREINYYSDLDIIFVYAYNGQTQKAVSLDNGAFFVKLAQKLISTLSVTTKAGRCYQIDTELRPSGNSGALVTSYDHFLDHQMNNAAHWERQALIRARAMADDFNFQSDLQAQITKLTYERPIPHDFYTTMKQIRNKVIQERAQNNPNGIDIKLAHGGIMDIEFILHKAQLKYAHIHKDLRTTSMFDLLKKLKNHNIFTNEQLENLSNAYTTFRTIESYLHLEKKRSESFLDYTSNTASLIAELLDLPGVDNLKEMVGGLMREITKQ